MIEDVVKSGIFEIEFVIQFSRTRINIKFFFSNAPNAWEEGMREKDHLHMCYALYTISMVTVTFSLQFLHSHSSFTHA